MRPVDQQSWAAGKRFLVLGDGRQIAFVDSGGAGPVLLLLHGYSDSSRSFSLLQPWLSTYRLVMPDLPGHGASLAGEDMTVAGIADDVAELLPALGIDRCIVIGHSMGAMVGMALSALLPETIGALVLISGTLRPAFPANGPVTTAILGLSDPINPADPFFAYWYAGPQPLEQTFLVEVNREAAAMPAAIWKTILAELSRLDLTATANRIAVPVLCLAGEDDMLFDSGHRLALAQALPKSQSIVISGSGHNPHWEYPSQVAQHATAFARGIYGTRVEPPDRHPCV
nr:alpha/beta hydrolase [uncultured Devosia sp.]